jgi:hypothetical protein
LSLGCLRAFPKENPLDLGVDGGFSSKVSADAAA